MDWLHSMIINLGRIMPAPARRGFRSTLVRAGTRMDPEEWLGNVITIGILVGTAAFFATWGIMNIFEPAMIALTTLGAFLLVLVAAWTMLYNVIDDRRQRIEKTLPDFLHILAANIRTGMSPAAALRMTARPEFGPLEEEIKYVTSRALGTESFTDLLRGMSERIPSEVFDRTIALIAASLKGGGQLAKLLESTADDIRENHELKQELITATNMYVMFVLFIVIAGTPLLLAVSYNFTKMVMGLQATPFGTPTVTGLEVVLTTPLSPDFVFSAGMVVIVVTGALASALIGAIREGTETAGLRYAPILITVSVVLYFVMKDYILKFLSPAGITGG
jgi:Flp pilus assembly protein TadB